MVQRVLDGEFGEPPDEDPERLRGLAKTLDRNGWSPGEVLAWAALFEQAKVEGLDPQTLASITGVFAKASKGACDPSEYLSLAAKLAMAEEAGRARYTDILSDYEKKLEAAKAAEERVAKLSSEEEELGRRLDGMRRDRDQLTHSLRDKGHELAVAQARASKANEEANSAEKRSKALDARIRGQLKYEERCKKENRILRQEEDRLIANVKQLQALQEDVRQRLNAEDGRLAGATSMRRETQIAAQYYQEQIQMAKEQIQMAKDLIQLITQGKLNPYGRLFHELCLAMKQADGTITPLESLGVSEGARERIRGALIQVLEENQKLPDEAKDLLLRYTLVKRTIEAATES
jgi:chromosome segregation ATPase